MPTPQELPIPPVSLAVRVGTSDPGPDHIQRYLETGEILKAVIVAELPDGWGWEGKRALDFGCGAGRVLRHFASEAEVGEFWGCDIDSVSIDWLRAELSPPFHCFEVTEQPAMPQESDFFDVVWAMSVFTHLTEHWAGWLLELHRVLRPGGYLLASYLGESMHRALTDDPWDEERTGMNVIAAGRSWEEGGPSVFHSGWWLRAHWGRAFDIVRLQAAGDEPGEQGIVLARKRDVAVSLDDLVRADPSDPRELAALQHNLEQLHAEDRRIRQQKERAESRIADLEERLRRRSLRGLRSRLRR